MNMDVLCKMTEEKFKEYVDGIEVGQKRECYAMNEDLTKKIIKLGTILQKSTHVCVVELVRCGKKAKETVMYKDILAADIFRAREREAAMLRGR